MVILTFSTAGTLLDQTVDVSLAHKSNKVVWS